MLNTLYRVHPVHPKIRGWLDKLTSCGCCHEISELHGQAKGYLEAQLDHGEISIESYQDMLVTIGVIFTNAFRDRHC